ncbi:MAG: hypothetical protein AAGG80_01265 [Pseudomonadota bacterium]
MFKPSQKRRLLTASLLAVAMVLAGCQSKEEKAIKFAESGQAYMDEGDFERATLQFNNALFQDGNPDATLNILRRLPTAVDYAHIVSALAT